MWFLFRKGYCHEGNDPRVPARHPSPCAGDGRRAARAPPRARRRTKITKEQATKVALEHIPGKVTDVTIERKRGKNVYVVEIQSPDQGEKDVLVDMESGKVVGTE